MNMKNDLNEAIEKYGMVNLKDLTVLKAPGYMKMNALGVAALSEIFVNWNPVAQLYGRPKTERFQLILTDEKFEKLTAQSKRVALAHETGHYLCDHLGKRKIGGFLGQLIYQVKTRYFGNHEEYEADEFALLKCGYDATMNFIIEMVQLMSGKESFKRQARFRINHLRKVQCMLERKEQVDFECMKHPKYKELIKYKGGINNGNGDR